MKFIISLLLAVACALAVALGGQTAPQATAYKTQLIRVEAVDIAKTKAKVHRVTRPRVARVRGRKEWRSRGAPTMTPVLPS